MAKISIHNNGTAPVLVKSGGADPRYVPPGGGGEFSGDTIEVIDTTVVPTEDKSANYNEGPGTTQGDNSGGGGGE